VGGGVGGCVGFGADHAHIGENTIFCENKQSNIALFGGISALQNRFVLST